MPHDPARVADTKGWLRKAREDLAIAAELLKGSKPFARGAVFHCQQAAEKSFKAFLVWHDEPFRKTHELEEIGEACIKLEATLKEIVDRAVPLTEYAWKFRYPGEPELPSKKEAKEALTVATEVLGSAAAAPKRGAAMSDERAIGNGFVFRPKQSRFLAIPQAPLCYWLRERFFELLAGPTLGDVADVCQGPATANDPRFVRFVWEVPLEGWAQPARERRWVSFEKGGGYSKWFGHHFWVVDWEHDGARIRSTPNPRVQNEQCYFKPGWTYSYMARGSLGLRLLDESTIFSHLASAIFFHSPSVGKAAFANSRFSSVVIRSVSAKIQLNESYVSECRSPVIARNWAVLSARRLS